MLLALAAVACQREAEAPQPRQEPATQQAPEDPPQAPETAGAPVLEDVIERDPRYVIGISYPPEAKQYPGLAAELHRYAQAAREELLQAVASMGEATPSAPYDLSLAFSVVVETPRVVAIAADGSSYTGGAHGNPLVARFVWLPRQEKMLRAQDLFKDEAGWRVVSDYVREQLHAALSTRVEAEDLEPAERVQTIRAAGRMIDEGSGPEPDNFEQFEPVMGLDGRITALRFVFPPYQVGPYADGTRSVVVPAEILAPYLAAPVRGLFAGG